MPPPGRFRVSIGELSVFIALVTVALAPQFRHVYGELASYTISTAITSSGMIGLYYFNRRLSPWIWLILASWWVPTIAELTAGLWPLSAVEKLFGMGRGFLQPIAASLMRLIGLALMFRDIRRKLAAPESPRSSPDNLPTRPPDGDAPPADVSWHD